LPVNAGKEAMKMGSNQPQTEELLNLEKSIMILETPFGEVCEVLGLDEAEPREFLEVDNCIFFFDPDPDPEPQPDPGIIMVLLPTAIASTMKSTHDRSFLAPTRQQQTGGRSDGRL